MTEMLTDRDRIVLPDDEHAEQLAAVRDALLAGTPLPVRLPAEVHDALLILVTELVGGTPVGLFKVRGELSTTEAANILGVSRPTAVKLAEAGDIDYTRPGTSHRRVTLDSVLAYRKRRQQARTAAVTELLRISEDAGESAVPGPMPFPRGDE